MESGGSARYWAGDVEPTSPRQVGLGGTAGRRSQSSGHREGLHRQCVLATVAATNGKRIVVKATRAYLLAAVLALAIVAIVVAVLVSGGDEERRYVGPPNPSARPPPTGVPDGGATTEGTTTVDEAAPPAGKPPTTPTYARLSAYKRRCEQINRLGAEAQVVYEASKEMKLGDSSDVRAAVSLNRSAPPEQVLPRTDAVGAPGLVVSCRLQARLSASEYDFDIDDSGWIDRSVYATDTVRWVWTVTPKLGGDHTLTLYVRPIVSQELAGADSETSRAAKANIRDYTTSVHVDVPWNKHPEELMTQIASTLSVAEGLVKGLTALILALVALLAALPRLRKWRRKRAEGAASSD
jgi:hypothetical protein